MMRKLTAIFVILVFGNLWASAQGDSTQLSGTIAAISGDHVSIKDAAGKTTILMTHKGTKYSKDDKPATSKDLKVGVRIAITAKMDTTMKMYKADEVKILP